MSSWIRETAYVEEKFLEQLKSLGWDTLTIADNDNKHRTAKALQGRDSFKDVILEDILSEAIVKINGDWLKEEQIKEVIATERNLEIKNILEILIQSIGDKIMSRKYDYIIGLATSDEKHIKSVIFQNIIDKELAIIGVLSDTGVDKFSREIKYIIDEDMESYYTKYRKYVR